MPLDEFGIIATYFSRPNNRTDVELPSGDDCAVLSPPQGKQLLLTIDTLNQGIHFFHDTTPYDIGYKAVAVSLSDIAAMGGEALWCLVSLTLDKPNDEWLRSFANGLFDCLDKYQVALVGGNLSKGPLAVTTQMTGAVSTKHYLTRSGAKVGDLIYVTGSIGVGGLALAAIKDPTYFSFIPDLAALMSQIWRPTPRLHEGQLLVDIASAAIDISDGLVADLRHILVASSVGASIYLEQLPFSSYFQHLPESLKQLALTSGDDYELCFTVPRERANSIQAISLETNCPMTCIGHIEGTRGLRVIDVNGENIELSTDGYSHF